MTTAKTKFIRECKTCAKTFSTRYGYLRHRRTGVCQGLKQRRFNCDLCNISFSRLDNLTRHKRRDHIGSRRVRSFLCGACDKSFTDKKSLDFHRNRNHRASRKFQLVASAHNRQCKLLRMILPNKMKTITEGLKNCYEEMQRLIIDLFRQYKFFKIHFVLIVEMVKYDEEGNVSMSANFPFRSHGEEFIRGRRDWKDILMRVCGDFDHNIDSFLSQGSGWSVNNLYSLDAELAACKILAGGHGGCSIHFAQHKYGKGVDVFNGNVGDDGMCFKKAVSQYFLNINTDSSQIKYDKLTFPMKVEDITLFEEENKDVAVNVIYQDEENELVPMRASKKIEAKFQIPLVLFCTKHGEKNEDVMHYSLIEEPEKLLSRRIRTEKGRHYSSSVHICWNCFNTSHRLSAYKNHVKFCHQNNSQIITMPEEGTVREFEKGKKNNKKIFNSAFMLFFDFESLQILPKKPCSCSAEVLENTKKMNDRSFLENEAMEDLMFQGSSERPYKKKKLKVCEHKTEILREQPPFAYAYTLVDRDGKVRERETYIGEDAAIHFIKNVVRIAEIYLPQLSPGEPVKLTAKEKRILKKREKCYLCKMEMMEDDRVIDHDHLNGKFLGVAHSYCNSQRIEQMKITCFAHNFTGYDSHFIIKAVSDGDLKEEVGDIDAIPSNTQKFKTLTFNKKIQFVDSLAFLSDSLANLVENLNISKSDFPIFEQYVGGSKGGGLMGVQMKEMLLRKGVYPYSFATSIQVLKEQVTLPERKAFYNELTEEECSEEDYAHAKKVWDVFQCENMLDYTTLYVETDVFLLADVVMDFRQNIWNSFKLDLCQYISLPQLAFDIMLKETKVQIEHIHQQDIADTLQKGIRGGHSYVGLRHFDKKEDLDSVAVYVDANNLYGKAMCFPLPISDVEWMSEEELEHFDPYAAKKTSGWGYILEVDLDYPKELHFKHNAMPLAPERYDIHEEDLSPYSKACLSAIGQRRAKKVTRLTATFHPRKNYLVHGLNLRLYLEQGLKLKKIHRGIRFWQEPFVKPFINKCSKKRMSAPTVSEQTMWKLVCNSVYGKVS